MTLVWSPENWLFVPSQQRTMFFDIGVAVQQAVKVSGFRSCRLHQNKKNILPLQIPKRVRYCYSMGDENPQARNPPDPPDTFAWKNYSSPSPRCLQKKIMIDHARSSEAAA